jgi:hypothetical protein
MQITHDKLSHQDGMKALLPKTKAAPLLCTSATFFFSGVCLFMVTMLLLLTAILVLLV